MAGIQTVRCCFLAACLIGQTFITILATTVALLRFLRQTLLIGYFREGVEDAAKMIARIAVGVQAGQDFFQLMENLVTENRKVIFQKAI